MDDAPRWETLKKSISDATKALAALEVRRREIELLLRAQEGELASFEAASKIAPRITALPTIEPPRTTSEKIALLSVVTLFDGDGITHSEGPAEGCGR